MSKKVILLNGAPNSGKDESAKILKKLFGFGSIHSFKDELYKETAEYYGLDLDKFKQMAKDRNLKDKINRSLVDTKGKGIFKRFYLIVMSFLGFIGITPREALIHVSERIIKPIFGEDYFGRMLLETILNDPAEYVYVPDSGFIEEIRPLVEAGLDVRVIRIHREGSSFENDSRIELTDEILSEFGIKGIDLYNNGTLEDLENNLLDISVDKLVK